MDLNDATKGWPGQVNTNQRAPNPTWPGQPGSGPGWPGSQPGSGPGWPGSQPGSGPGWPGSEPVSGHGWPGSEPVSGHGWPGPVPGSGPGPGSGLGPGLGPGFETSPQKNLTVPYQHKLPYGVHNKLLITIDGTMKPKADKITVDFSASDGVAFHLNIRFNDKGQKVIVRNTYIKKQWGKEEREADCFPFVQGQRFEMKILCTDKEYRVAVNNSHLLTFKHRLTDLKDIKTFSIYNDLTLNKVTDETLP